MPSLKEDLLRPEAYASWPGRVELAETHISWVFLAGDAVFKVKRPVSLGFLDFRSLEQRRRACEAEVSLNQRLAPGIYLGVEPVRLGADGRHRLFGEGEVVDWAVHMVRLPELERADARLQAGTLSTTDVERLALLLSTFHAQARCDDETARFGTIEAIRLNVLENFDQTRDTLGAFVTTAQADEIRTWQLDFLNQHKSDLEARIRNRRIRDGHGDLRLEQIYFREGGGIAILDCIEFNERFRFADVCADLAFLSMDFADHDRVDLAELLLASYCRESNDYDLYALVDFYESYRAFIRGKVSAMLATDASVSAAARERAAAEARRYFLLALAAGREPLSQPKLIAVGGIIASGKTTVATALGREMPAAVVEADRTRKFILGVAPTQRLPDAAWQGAYAPELTEKVYAEVLRRADVVLASGRPVIVDASFRSRLERDGARALATRYGVPFYMVEVRCDPEVCRRRLARRAEETGVSDGRLDIFDEFRARFEPMTELRPEEHTILDTDQPLTESLRALRETLDRAEERDQGRIATLSTPSLRSPKSV